MSLSISFISALAVPFKKKCCAFVGTYLKISLSFCKISKLWFSWFEHHLDCKLIFLIQIRTINRNKDIKIQKRDLCWNFLMEGWIFCESYYLSLSFQVHLRDTGFLLKIIGNFVLLNKLAVLSHSKFSLYQHPWFFPSLLNYYVKKNPVRNLNAFIIWLFS